MNDAPDNCCGDVVATTPAYRRILWTVLVVNLSMFVIEGSAGITAFSVALQADALDFLGDSASYAISLFVLSLAMRWRTGAAMVKGVSMGLFGLWVVGATVWSFIVTGKPSAVIMGSIGMLALIANVFSAFLLYRFREGDANMRSVWLCSRNDAISNIAVMIAASGVFYTGQNWPDLLVAIIMAGLALFASFQVIRHATQEWRQTKDQGSTIT
ncbi:MAG: cation transporter [Alphaproteobacteria bacterium]|jgi:Co/Zn/Cd efflux system component